MELYHGSNVVVQTPKILTASRTLDFGKGFYTTSSFEQAAKWAINRQKKEKDSSAVVSVYSIDDDFLGK